MNDISLSILQEGDIELVRKWRNSKDVAPYMYSEEEITKEQQKLWFNKIKNDTTSIYWIIEYNGLKLGLASLNGISESLSSCSWAFYLGDLSVRKAGIGAKVEFNVLEYVFNTLKLNKLRCEVLITNPNVIKMHEKFGFRREAYLREHCVKNKEKIDAVGLGILKSEWDLISGIMRKKIYGK